jgi:hypothetical protein
MQSLRPLGDLDPETNANAPRSLWMAFQGGRVWSSRSGAERSEKAKKNDNLRALVCYKNCYKPLLQIAVFQSLQAIDL